MNQAQGFLEIAAHTNCIGDNLAAFDQVGPAMNKIKDAHGLRGRHHTWEAAYCL